ncbi:MAG: branched-chain amino acid ABC transporter permease, partial [Xanthomonadales bacterium]|nr:branched-chain amino acid ABC transporter permease [Xanthomonadales bacterium]
MEQFIQHSITGIMTGSIYGLMALALVMIFRSTGMINFGQGEMATFTTLIAWSLLLNLPYAVAFVVVLALAFALGATVERGLIRLVEHREPMAAVIVGLALFLIFNSFSNSIYGP